MGHVDFDHPDETRTFANGRWEIVHVGESTVARATLTRGWKWSNDVKPLVGSSSCQHRHVGYLAAGQLDVTMDDGSTFSIRAGDTYVIEPGHDAESVGADDAVGYEFSSCSAESYAKKS